LFAIRDSRIKNSLKQNIEQLNVSSGSVIYKQLALAGNLAVFRGDESPHEVLAADRDRYSVAGWFRVNGSINQQLDPPR